ncbi:LysR family transcriptional regulator [Paracoccus aminophilus]|uniref:Transcriptional regulator, LysR family n=1 Tax=Paracoccus aminophilus JCM 7686 TaxID=1367847 RepID=S5Z0M7_PARAH|nr:LysR family transcriptional regulator [Paracoccus aminophilus]AGT11006.1 transcriptional regulator, LysR family [Paracoccus aminophilus JCM 7686]
MSFDSRLLSGIGVLSAVVQAGSFARAGEALGLTQPAVSRAVARLEDRVGIRIFNRTARAISLTDEGRRFFEAVAPLLAGIEEAAIDAAGSKAHVRGRLRVNVDATFAHYILAPKLAEFLDLHPDLAVEISVRDRMGDLVAEGFDLAVRFGPMLPSNYKAQLLLETRVFTCASKAYLDRYGEPQHPNDLATGHHCLFIRDPVTGRPFEWEFRRGDEIIPLDATGRLMVNDSGSLVGACFGGAGLAQLLELYAADMIASGKVSLILPDWTDETFPLYAYYQNATFTSAKVRAFLDFIGRILAP